MTVVGANGLVYLVSLARPFYFPRLIIFAIPALGALVGAGWLPLARHGQGVVVAAALTVAMTAPELVGHYRAVRTGYSPDDFLVVMGGLRGSAEHGDVVVAGYPWPAGYVRAYLGDGPLLRLDRGLEGGGGTRRRRVDDECGPVRTRLITGGRDCGPRRSTGVCGRRAASTSTATCGRGGTSRDRRN